MKPKNIIMAILGAILTALSGVEYQQFSALNEVQKSVNDLGSIVASLAHKDIGRVDPE